MGILDTLKQMASLSPNQSFGDKPVFRCINCGGEFERQYVTCPDCRGRYLVEVDPD